ncbi:YceD family protein [Sphingosinicella rhizophila]|uniref:YceD family protein n=1 Tax=Sphingosinicella rhizophila TaxID=3050082 RepID=A0ABU3Q881_9SPHN|nr:YceD family protein [Sphingosinicella sp. GR2756]MDT9599507.1 YceD family protein [Sphingosinicella sp. GR2756]
MTDQPEFSRPVRIDSLSEAPRRIAIEADEGEKRALARRFDLAGLDRLTAEVALSRSEETVTAQGSLSAAVAQSCVVTGEAVETEIAEPFALSFRPPPEPGAAEEEVELAEAEMDVIFFEGGNVDIGEAVAQTLSLALDPYPRAPIAEAVLRDAGVKSEEEAGPFGALAALRDKMKP